MIVTSVGTDYIEINEENMYDKSLQKISRVHLIKLSFDDPTERKVKKVMEIFPKTNRFVIEKDVKVYNFILRGTNKKYYVSNVVGTDMVSFFRKNNKILVNFNYFDENDKYYFLSDNVFVDLLRNVEVINIDKDIFNMKCDALEKWSGNTIISDK